MSCGAWPIYDAGCARMPCNRWPDVVRLLPGYHAATAHKTCDYAYTRNNSRALGNEKMLVYAIKPGTVTITVSHKGVIVDSITLMISEPSPSPKTNLIDISGFDSRIDRWAYPIRNYLYKNEDGSISELEVTRDKIIHVKTLIPDSLSYSNIDIPFELNYYGAFYNGNEYNFIAFGQDNMKEDNDAEVIRIVKYDKSFNRLDSISISNIGTRIPFDLGCPRMAEYNDVLYLYTSRERYTSDDGKNHQSNLAIFVNTETMTKISGSTPLVSHSFDQHILFDYVGNPVFLDHGDANPRSVTIYRGGNIVSNGDKTRGIATMFDIPGEKGANYTGVSTGGLAISDNNYLTAITTIDHNIMRGREYGTYGYEKIERDIVLCIIPRQFSNFEVAKQKIIGKYIGTGTNVSNPRLLTNGDNTFTVIWREWICSTRQIAFYDEGLNYIVQKIDGNGELLGDKRYFEEINDFYKEFLGVSMLPSEYLAMSNKSTLETSQSNVSLNATNTTNENITILLNGETVNFDVPPQLINDRLLVPLRIIFEKMGATISFDEESQTVTATKYETVVILQIGDSMPTVNGQIVTIDQPGIIIDGRTLAPLRFVAEAFGGTVEWDEATQTANIIITK